MAFQIKKGDTSPAIEATVTDQDGDPVDLTGATIYFRMQDISTHDTLFDKEASIVDATEGMVEYNWQSGDTDTPGMYYAEFQIEFSQTNVQTHPRAGYKIVEVSDSLE